VREGGRKEERENELQESGSLCLESSPVKCEKDLSQEVEMGRCEQIQGVLIR
jgi:hypothetical protein